MIRSCKGMVINQACRVFYFLQFTITCWCTGLLGVNEKLHSFFLLSYRLLCLIYIETVVEGGIFTRIVNHNTIINQISRTLKISSIAEQQHRSPMAHEFLQYTKVQMENPVREECYSLHQKI